MSQDDIVKDKLENGAVNKSESLTDIFPTIKKRLNRLILFFSPHKNKFAFYSQLKQTKHFKHFISASINDEWKTYKS